MAFATAEDVMHLTEDLLKAIAKSEHMRYETYLSCPSKGFPRYDTPSSFPRMSYREALTRYGSDKPDLRLGMEVGHTLVTNKLHQLTLVDQANAQCRVAANTG